MKIKIVCKICKKEFHDYESNHRKHCSRNCYVISMAGHKPKTCYEKGHISWSKLNPELMPRGENHHVFGKHITLNTGRTHFKKGIIPWNKGKTGLNSKEEHWNWKGGIDKDKAHVLNRKRVWRDNNRIKVYLSNKNYLNRRRKTKLTMETIQLVYEDNIKKYGVLTCYLCEQPLQFGKDSLEHKIPLSRGGDNSYCNLGISCQSCNSKKHTKTVDEFKKKEV